MWEDRKSRKYAPPQSGINQFNSNAFGNRGYDETEDLHAWSIYRQNLNADLSESAIGINKSSNTERPFGNFQLRETTVKNILNHPKYGPRLRDHDPATYLRYGLPRVKVVQSELGPRLASHHPTSANQSPSHHHSHHNLHRPPSAAHHHHHRPKPSGGGSGLSDHHHNPSANQSPSHHHSHHNLHRPPSAAHHHQHPKPSSGSGIGDHHRIPNGNQGMTSDSASISDYEVEIGNLKQQNVRRTWKSDPDLIRAGELIDNGDPTHYRKKSHMINANPHHKYSSQAPMYNKAVSESDLRHAAVNGNGLTSGHRTKSNGAPYNSELHDETYNTVLPKHPHLIVRGLYYEIDKTSKLKRFCGAQRTKLRIFDNISFEVRAGEVLAVMSANGKCYS